MNDDNATIVIEEFLEPGSADACINTLIALRLDAGALCTNLTFRMAAWYTASSAR
jgi:hypothetical protein